MTTGPSPFTLRSAAGLETEPGRLADSTVVVIDAQMEYRVGSLALPDVDQAAANIARLLDAARAAGAPVIHVAHLGQPGGMFDPENGGRIIDSVRPGAGEPVVTKKLPNSFAGTDLADHLDHLGRRPLLLAGFMTHMCVSATARAALDLGFDSTVVSDATATRPLPSTQAGQPAMGAEVVHQVALAELADRFSVVATTDAVLAS